MNRQEYIMRLNELAAICVMGWTKSECGLTWLGTHGHEGIWVPKYDAGNWNPCEIDSQTILVIQKILGWKDIDGYRRWRFGINCMSDQWNARFMRHVTERAASDPVWGVAVVRAAVKTCGGRAPGYVREGEED